jgi:hypothetical protein
MTADGIGKMIRRRGAQAGIEGLHPHQFRHRFAHSWLSEEGTEGDLMRLAGATGRCCPAMAPSPPTSAPARRTGACPLATGSDGRNRSVHAPSAGER